MQGLEIPLNLPDLWQQEAVRALKEGRDAIVDAPTGAGKTRIFEMLVGSRDATRRGQAVYTVPTRALANDKWHQWRTMGWNVGIATGDVAENIDAPVLVATLETQRERMLSRRAPGFLVIDEYQMLSDSRRGLSYEIVIATAPPETQLLLLSGSVRNPEDIQSWLERLGRKVTLIRERHRPVPLEEIPSENLPKVRGNDIGFWPRVAAGAVLGHLTPLLIFVPRRAEAEKIARKVAAILPADDPIPLTLEDERTLGKELSGLLQHRVAYHHSGLPYATRADWIEPLARNGKLQVVVATTGLAAGINFSVRSVLIAETRYQDGPYQRELMPDELLQMFGRAGRRGLDSKGTIIVAPRGPGLREAAPRQLKRVNELDWPTLLRLMEEAATRGEPPVAAAAAMAERLFSRQRVSMGFEEAAAESEGADRFGPTREEFFDSANQWVPAKSAREVESTLDECLALRGEAWSPALRIAALAEKYGPGRLCKLKTPTGFSYGKELIVARAVNGRLAPLAWIQKSLHLAPGEQFSPEDFMTVLIPLLQPKLEGARPVELVERGPMRAVRLDLGAIRVKGVVDSHQRVLLDAPRRRAAIKAETTYISGENTFRPRLDTPAAAWRKLGLVSETGVPTSRGRIFSRFQAGEGLMIAAALEDHTYDPEEIVMHLANLRGGHRFVDVGGGSSRLSIAARAVYGHVDYEGYLQAGLCVGYGEGVCEAIERYKARKTLDSAELRPGDIERAIVEWQSLLRHITHAPDPDVERWDELRKAAADCLAKQGATSRYGSRSRR